MVTRRVAPRTLEETMEGNDFAAGAKWAPGGGTVSAIDEGYEKASNGVTALWLAQVFKMSALEVKQRLATCPTIRRGPMGYIYNVRIAAGYLVRPVVDLEQYLRNLKTTDLPPQLQDAFWSAMNKRNKYEEEAKLLWRTEHVMKLIGEMVLTIANDHRMWIDDMEEHAQVTEDQRVFLSDRVRALDKTMHDNLAKLSKATRIRPIISEKPEDDQAFGLTEMQHDKIERNVANRVARADKKDDTSVFDEFDI